MIPHKLVKLVELSDWDALVKKIYNRPYSLQQQDGCMPRGTVKFTLPLEEVNDFVNDEVPEVINGPKYGVSFNSWLNRDVNKPIPNREGSWYIQLFFHRNFYPSLEAVANDLFLMGLLEPGNYVINIDW